jgi:hypothetical protein
VKVKYIITIIIYFCALFGVTESLYLMDNKINQLNIGSDSKGYVIKDVYAANGQHPNKIAIITGMHPREKIAIDPMKTAVRNYALTHDIEVTDYDIHVLNNPENYTIGRFNGEELAAQYVIPDIKKTDYKLVIIFHAHQEGYGEGFYISTPAMDKKSVKIAENVPKITPLKYYKPSENEYKSTSALKVSDPIAEEGYPTFVYEIPENSDVEDATNRTNELLDVFLNHTK